MADIQTAPKIKCDNCGLTAEKQSSTVTNGIKGDWRKPDGWGHAHVGGLFCKPEISFPDLCPTCTIDAVDALQQFSHK
jgi:hypothetical protein